MHGFLALGLKLSANVITFMLFAFGANVFALQINNPNGQLSQHFGWWMDANKSFIYFLSVTNATEDDTDAGAWTKNCAKIRQQKRIVSRIGG